MTDSANNPLEASDTEAARNFTKNRAEDISEFVNTRSEYYVKQFNKIGESARFTTTFNLAAGLLGPIWFGARGLWTWAIPFLIIETFGLVQIARGLFGDLAADAWARIASIEGTLELRRKQLAAALESESDKVAVYQRTVQSLEENIGGIRLEAEAMASQGPSIALSGLAVLLLAKLIQAVVGNWALEKRFSEWLSDRSVRSGMPTQQLVFSAVFMGLIVFAAMLHYSFPGKYALLNEFPTHASIRTTAISWVEQFFAFAVSKGDGLFDAITYSMRLS